MNVNRGIFEGALASILIFSLLLIFRIDNQLILTILAFLLLIFISLGAKSLLKIREANYQIRLYCLVAIAITLHGYLLANAVFSRIYDPNYSVHDGALITEESYRQLMLGKNPYSISYEALFLNQVDYADKIAHGELNRNIYSPFAFLINFPVFLVTEKIFGILDMRIFSVMSLFMAAILSLAVVREKVLFLIIFLFNPIFVKSVYFGANDVLILLLFCISLLFLYFRKILLATIVVALGSSTKLLFLPFVPLYFLFLASAKKGDKRQLIFKNLVTFTLVCVVIYLPFIIWNPGDFFDDFFIYNLLGGDLGRPIAGFLGIPQILNKFGLIAGNDTFPFFILAIPLSVAFVFYAAKVLRNSTTLPLLVFLYAVLFGVVFSFSRIVQSDYLTYLSQVLVLSAFLKDRG